MSESWVDSAKVRCHDVWNMLQQKQRQKENTWKWRLYGVV